MSLPHVEVGIEEGEGGGDQSPPVEVGIEEGEGVGIEEGEGGGEHVEEEEEGRLAHLLLSPSQAQQSQLSQLEQREQREHREQRELATVTTVVFNYTVQFMYTEFNFTGTEAAYDAITGDLKLTIAGASSRMHIIRHLYFSYFNYIPILP